MKWKSVRKYGNPPVKDGVSKGCFILYQHKNFQFNRFIGTAYFQYGKWVDTDDPDYCYEDHNDIVTHWMEVEMPTEND